MERVKTFISKTTRFTLCKNCGTRLQNWKGCDGRKMKRTFETTPYLLNLLNSRRNEINLEPLQQDDSVCSSCYTSLYRLHRKMQNEQAISHPTGDEDMMEGTLISQGFHNYSFSLISLLESGNNIF